MIDAETNFPELDVVLKWIEPQLVLSFFVGRQHKMEPVLESAKKAIRDGLIHFDGIAIDVFHGDEVMELESPRLGDDQHEILIPVKETQPGDVTLENIGMLMLRQTEAIETAATLILHGINHDERYEKAALLRRWAVAHEYTLQNELRYVHHRGPLETFDRIDWITEIQLVVNAHD
jgi:hypothetical protein